MPSAVYQRVCQALKKGRLDRDLSQRELARRLGRPITFVAAYELCRRILKVDELLQVAHTLKLNPVRLIRHARAGARNGKL